MATFHAISTEAGRTSVAMHKAESPCAAEQWQDSLTNQMATEYLGIIDKNFNSLHSSSVHISSKSNGHVCNDLNYESKEFSK